MNLNLVLQTLLKILYYLAFFSAAILLVMEGEAQTRGEHFQDPDSYFFAIPTIYLVALVWLVFAALHRWALIYWPFPFSLLFWGHSSSGDTSYDDRIGIADDDSGGGDDGGGSDE